MSSDPPTSHDNGRESDDAEHPDPAPDALGSSAVANLPGLAAFASLGMTIAVCEGLGVVAGLWADRTWGTAPGGLIIGIVLGTVVAVLSVVKQVRRFL